MSLSSSSPAGLPLVQAKNEPAWVRSGSSSTQQAYATALGFEQVLVEQLAKSMTATSGLGGEEGEGATGDAASAPMTSMLPQALAAGVMSAGGLGLAAQMTHQLQAGQLSAAAAHTAGAGA